MMTREMQDFYDDDGKMEIKVNTFDLALNCATGEPYSQAELAKF